ncbi:MAG TPA: hypothetical protein PKW33_21980 [Anaerolineaceae bacterium]|nr:hypothetical protein [Anaerolineaceae bacterium]HPN54278.1 hypothetical protein [Anaerolineaceae bacterium]
MSTNPPESKIPTRPFFLDAVDQLPPPLLELTLSNLPAGQSVEGIFVVPSDTHWRDFGWWTSPIQALVFTHQGVLQVIGPLPNRRGTTKWIPADMIILIKLSLILLYGKLEIYYLNLGRVEKSEMEYNTVSHKLLAPCLRKLIQKTWQLNPPPRPCQPDATFPDFVRTSYSFYNGLISEAISPGETVLGYVYQPEIHEPWLKIFRKKVAPKLVLAVTDQQITILQEEMKTHAHNEWVFSFIPLHRVSFIQQRIDRSWIKLVINLKTEGSPLPIEIILEPAQASKWAAIWRDGRLNEG